MLYIDTIKEIVITAKSLASLHELPPILRHLRLVNNDSDPMIDNAHKEHIDSRPIALPKLINLFANCYLCMEISMEESKGVLNARVEHLQAFVIILDLV